MVRPGIALYGPEPLINRHENFSKVIVLKGIILKFAKLTCPRPLDMVRRTRRRGPTRIATVPVGYADGYPRGLKQRGLPIVDGVRVPVVGRVSMDLITLDVSAIPQPLPVGTEVTLLVQASTSTTCRCGRHDLLRNSDAPGTALSPRLQRCG